MTPEEMEIAIIDLEEKLEKFRNAVNQALDILTGNDNDLSQRINILSVTLRNHLGLD